MLCPPVDADAHRLAHSLAPPAATLASDCTCDSLADIRYTNNAIGSVCPAAFAGLSNCGYLSLRGNRIGALPDGMFDDLTSLVVLFLSDNELTAVGSAAAFQGMPLLEEIDLRGNRLTSVPDGLFSGLSRLELLMVYVGRHLDLMT